MTGPSHNAKECVMGDRYPVGTLIDMARIPQEARARFLKELPSMLDNMQPMLTLRDTLGEAFKVNPVWIDDDKGMATVNVSVRNADGESRLVSSRSFKIDDQ